jgi:hypothetical protein
MMRAQAKRFGPRKASATRPQLMGLFFDRICYERCSKNHSALDLFRTTIVALSIPAHCSHRSQVERIAASASQPIESLARELDGGGSPRGSALFNNAATCIDQIATNYKNMRWWITDKGLNMACIELESSLSEFDAVAGKLLEEHWKGDRLSQELLLVVATALDEKRLLLKEHLQPGFRKKIAVHNIAAPKKAIKTFEQAVKDARFVDGVRRRLYVARKRFKSCQNEGDSGRSPGCLVTSYAPSGLSCELQGYLSAMPLSSSKSIAFLSKLILKLLFDTFRYSCSLRLALEIDVGARKLRLQSIQRSRRRSSMKLETKLPEVRRYSSSSRTHVKHQIRVLANSFRAGGFAGLILRDATVPLSRARVASTRQGYSACLSRPRFSWINWPRNRQGHILFQRVQLLVQHVTTRLSPLTQSGGRDRDVCTHGFAPSQSHAAHG